ncbi:MAG TPA: DUF1214 domain-containing protein [Rhizomicrobium sp.]|jgi:hypothetical protein
MSQAIPVTADSFIRAETDMYFGHIVKNGGFAKFEHHREPADIDKQDVIRLNRDTLYSGAVFDLDAGSVTIILPDAGKRFMSMEVFDEDEYVAMVSYGAGRHVFTKDKIGTRYMCVAVRTFVDPDNADDVRAVRALQDAINVEQENIGSFQTPAWDMESQKSVRNALLALGSTLPDFKNAFGKRDEVDPIRHLIGAAAAWGGNPDKEAMYLNVTPQRNDGKTAYRLKIKNVPVDGFWSVIVYNKEGYIPKNDRGVYSFNGITSKKDADGAVTIQFGGDTASAANVLSIVPEWNYMVRLYRPRPEILNNQWKFPEAQPVA